MQREVPGDLFLAGSCMGQSCASGRGSEGRRSCTGGSGIRGCGCREPDSTVRKDKDGELIKEESKGLGNPLKDSFAHCCLCAQCPAIISNCSGRALLNASIHVGGKERGRA